MSTGMLAFLLPSTILFALATIPLLCLVPRRGTILRVLTTTLCCFLWFRFDTVSSVPCHCHKLIHPANTFDDPAATDVQPDIPSPTLPHPLPFTLTVELPLAIAAE